MTRTQRARTHGCAALIVVVGLLAGCGRQSVASKSAAAYQEAVRNGTPVTGGHEHGGHAAEPGTTAPQDHGAMAGMGHESMPGMATGADETARMPAMNHSPAQNGPMSGMDHSKMQSGSMSGMNHSKMQSGTMPGMDHSKMQSGSMPGMNHSKTPSGSMPGMDQSKMPSGSMPGMDHSKMPSGSMPGMDQSKTPRSVNSGTLGATTASQTLSLDSFDAPVKTSFDEAAKPTGAPAQPAHDMGAMNPTGADSPSAITPSRINTAEAVYTCPMHPEVTSTRPGKCPKCGMTLVRKK